MAVESYPFDGQVISETQYSRYFREIKGTGVLGDVTGTSFKVTAPGSGMGLSIGVGAAIVRGHYVESDAVESLNLLAGTSQPRTDIVVLRLNPATNSIVIDKVQGTPGAGLPTLTQTDTGIFEWPLASVAVGASVTAVGNAQITDLRRFSPEGVGVWTTALRPGTPRVGAMGYNTTLAQYEVWNGSIWATIVPASLITQVNTIASDLDALESQAATLASQYTTLQGQYTTLSSTYSSVPGQLDALEDSVDDIEAALDSLHGLTNAGASISFAAGWSQSGRTLMNYGETGLTFLNIRQATRASAISSTAGVISPTILVATLPEGYRPEFETPFVATGNNQNFLVGGTIGTNGEIRLHHLNPSTTTAASPTFSIQVAFFSA